ncbi:MAG: baseplate J/gp47 family protein [Candidatus Nomurabacteria bacterium]|nr:MAG: baseplate J/gp47 family protein [Candidatus Nomurabacteria bacterium]
MEKRHSTQGQLPKSYARAAIIFIFIVLIAGGGVLYLSLSRTIVTITPRQQEYSVTVPVAVREDEIAEGGERSDNSTIQGMILTATRTRQGTFTSLGEGSSVADTATGRVTIYNNWNQTQPLAATTRFLTEDGVLFRLKERVDVPAASSIEAEVYADEKGAIGNIGPSRFTLPGLWPGLQEKIYAESTTAMTGGLKEVKSVSAEDLRQAENTLRSQIVEDVRSFFQDSLAGEETKWQLLDDALIGTITEKDFSAEVGDQVEDFTGSLTLKVDGVAILPSDIAALAATRLTEEIPDNTIPLSSDAEEIETTVTKINTDTQTAELSITGTIDASTTLANPIFSRSNLVSRSRQEILEYFSSFPEVAAVSIRFSPFWATQAASLEDHIEIRFNQPEQ